MNPEPRPAPEPDPIDDYDRDARTRQGRPDSMRCRLCNAAKVIRRVRYPDGTVVHVYYCAPCDSIPLRSKG